MAPKKKQSVCKLVLLGILVSIVATTGIATAIIASPPSQTEHLQATTQIDSCTTITEPGRYALTQDIQNTSTGPCIRITASDVILEGNGHTLAGGVDERAIDAFVNATNQTGAYPEMPEWDTVGVAANASQPLSNVTVQNLTARNWFFGIYYNNVTNGAISNARVTENGEGVSVYDTTDVLVSQNDVRDNVAGIVGDGANSTTVRSNTVVDNMFPGVVFFNTEWNTTGLIRFSGTVTNNDITNNTVTANDGGILVDTGANNTIRENTVTDNNFTGIAILFNATRNTVSNNTVVNNSQDGISIVFDATENTVTDNRVSQNGVNGILLLNNSTTNEVTANRLTANGHSGIALVENSNDNLVASNEITNTTGRDNFTAETGYAAGIVVNGSSNNVIRDTTARNNTNWTFYSLKNATNNTVESLTIDETVTVSFTGRDVALTRQTRPPVTDEGVAQTRIGAGLVLANTSPTASLRNLRVQWQSPARQERGDLDTVAIQALVVELPGVGQVGPPTDPDGDGRYEDVTGDKRVTTGDVAALAVLNIAQQGLGLQLSPEQAAAFDFTGDGQFNGEDVLALASEILSRQAT